MKKNNKLLSLGIILCLWTSCSDTSTSTNSSSSTNINSIDGSSTSSQEGNSSSPEEVKPNSTENKQDPKKSDGEIILEGGKVLLETVTDVVEQQRMKDSIRQANKERMFAFQIGLKMREKDAFEAYTKLTNASIPSVYVFKAGRKEYYVVQFEAKGEQELDIALGDFKTQLGDLGTEGLKVINLNDFCSKKETVAKYTADDDGDEIKCLQCD